MIPFKMGNNSLHVDVLVIRAFLALNPLYNTLLLSDRKSFLENLTVIGLYLYKIKTKLLLKILDYLYSISSRQFLQSLPLQLYS